MKYVRGELCEVLTEVLYGAVGEHKRVVERGVGETYWCRRHDVLVRAAAVVTVTIVLRCETAYNMHDMPCICASTRSKAAKHSVYQLELSTRKLSAASIKRQLTILLIRDQTFLNLLTTLMTLCTLFYIIPDYTASRIYYQFAIGSPRVSY